MGTSKKRKAVDTKAYSESAPRFDITQMSEKERENTLQILLREQNARKAQRKTAQTTKEKRAEASAEAAYQAEQARQAKQSNSKKRGRGSSDDEVDERSSAGYESDGDRTSEFAIDPLLRGKGPRATPKVTNGAKDNVGSKTPVQRRGKNGKADTAAETAPVPAAPSKGPAQITVSSAVVLQTALQAPRTLKKQLSSNIRPASLSESSPSDTSSDSDSSASEEDKRAKEPGPHTPYRRPQVTQGKKAPALNLLSPTSKSIVDRTRTGFAAFLSVEDAFPDEKTASKKARKLFLAQVDSAVALDQESEDEDDARRARRADRFFADAQYKKDMIQTTTAVNSTFRGHIITDAQPLVEAEYGLLDMDTSARRELVQNLLHRSNFTFEIPETRTGPFLCPVIWRLLRKSFLSKEVKNGYALGLGPNLHIFTEVPPALLAFLMTAIECVLRRYASGKYDKHHFTMTKYEPIYTRHLKALHQAECATSEGLTALRKDIWQKAIQGSDFAASIEVTSLDNDGGYMEAADLAQLSAAVAS